MARRLRLFAADIPYHVIQRGNNRNPIFFSEEDYLFFLDTLAEAKIKHPCLVLGYCLMTNHFHLLLQPKEKDNVSLLIKLLGGKYVRYINKAYKRTGTLWEGRFKCCLIDKNIYFLSCLRYIETNPVRAGMVVLPELYRWSSYRARAFGEKNAILDLDSWYNGLGPNPQEQQLNYRKFFKTSMPESELKLIREMTQKNGLIGCSNFKEGIQRITGKKIIFRDPGRPANSEK